MLRALGSARWRQRRLDRREFLRAGALGVGALGAASQIAASEPSGAAVGDVRFAGFGSAKRCLVLYIYGAWSQLDTFDPKPNAPAEIRGDFATIDTCLPGVRICEHLPRSAKILDRVTLIRSMSHPWNIHSAAYTLTGNPDTERIEGRQRNPDHWPYFGGVIDYLADQGEYVPRTNGTASPTRGNGDLPPRGTPNNVMLPWRQSLFARPNQRAGTFGGFLGPGYDPLWTEFRGEAPLGDPFRAITPEGRFSFGVEAGAAINGAATNTSAINGPSINLDALDRRRSLLAQFDAEAKRHDRVADSRGYARQRKLALDMLANSNVRDALRLEREDDRLRDEYGMTLFGQACLTARRLLEADVPFVTVLWDEFGQTDESWDTHYDHHSRLKEFLLPAFDRAFSALLADLDRRGLLEDTLVLCLSEHGRTPRFYHMAAGAPGRDHWSRAYCQLVAGAGTPRGQVVGSTDKIAAEVLDRSIDPKDILRVAYHRLGINADRVLYASPSRPEPLVGGGRLAPELFGG